MKYRNLGKKIKEIRATLKLSQTQFIEKTGLPISKQFLSQVESGKINMPIKHQKRVSDMLSVDISSIRHAWIKDLTEYYRKEIESN